MIIPAPNPVAFCVFGFRIYWYGIIMAFALFFAILFANKLFNSQSEKTKSDVILSYAPILIICGILGARIYFCMLNPSYYFSHPLEILDIREGGLSIHGGLLGGILALFCLSLKDKISILRILDSVSCATFLGQAIGRWGNYFNSEAFGFPVSNQAWGLFVPENFRPIKYLNYQFFHPTFLYESLLDFVGFGILLLILRYFGKRHNGIVFFSYLILYAIIRFFVETLRIDSALNIGELPIAKIASLIMLLIGIGGLCTIFLKDHFKNS
jgi:phosphatidylglycerol:prolipoprotein diacylglycerol transferase